MDGGPALSRAASTCQPAECLFLSGYRAMPILPKPLVWLLCLLLSNLLLAPALQARVAR